MYEGRRRKTAKRPKTQSRIAFKAPYLNGECPSGINTVSVYPLILELLYELNLAYYRLLGIFQIEW